MREIVFGWLQDIAFYTLLMEVVLHVLPEQEQLADDEDILAISRRLISKNQLAYEELAK